MSHGASEKNEPNLTPLLDVVLQLVMFFMISANFIMEQSDESIQLPTAHAARPMEKAVLDPVLLNVKKTGIIDIYKAEYKSPGEVESKLRQVAEDTKKTLSLMKRDTKEYIEKPIIIRADKDVEFGKIYPVLQAARSAGFEKIQLRALKQ